jgi:ferrous iron transport protein A
MITIINNEKKTSLLGELRPGTRAEIVGFNPATEDQEAFLHRLFEVGFLLGSMLEVLQESPYAGDPISIRIKEATYALRRAEANLVQVKIL